MGEMENMVYLYVFFSYFDNKGVFLSHILLINIMTDNINNNNNNQAAIKCFKSFHL